MAEIEQLQEEQPEQDKLKTSSEEYKIDYCTLAEDECDGHDCRVCERAIAEAENSEKARKQAELEEYTIFTTPGKIGKNKLTVQRNSANIIAKTDPETLKQLQQEGIISATPRPYSPENIEQYNTQLPNLMKYNNLGTPDEMWADRDKPGVFRFGDLYFLIAPRIESEG